MEVGTRQWSSGRRRRWYGPEQVTVGAQGAEGRLRGG